MKISAKPKIRISIFAANWFTDLSIFSYDQKEY